MTRFLADENFNGDITRGLRRRIPDLDIVRVQDVGLRGAEDPDVLAWAAEHDRVLLTHDVSTITRYAYERIGQGLLMPGVFEVSRRLGAGAAIEELILIAQCSLEGEWQNQVRYLPLR